MRARPTRSSSASTQASRLVQASCLFVVRRQGAASAIPTASVQGKNNIIGTTVDLIVGRANLGKDMSHYLVERIRAHHAIRVHTDTTCTALRGDGALRGVMVTSSTGVSEDLGCDGLFCLISAEPATGWLTEVALDPDGSIWTDRDLESTDLGVAWELIGRSPVPFETSIPGVFAAGDARSGAVKRVAASVGEGASAVKSVHRILVP